MLRSRLLGRVRVACFLLRESLLPVFVLRIANAEREDCLGQSSIAARTHADEHHPVGARFDRADIGRWSLRVSNHALRQVGLLAGGSTPNARLVVEPGFVLLRDLQFNSSPTFCGLRER